MPAARQPLFLARASYRKRRLRDGARVLPIFGTVLVLLPLMWPQVQEMVVVHWAYVFALWVVLIGLAAILARGLGDSETASPTENAIASAPDMSAGSNKNRRSAPAKVSRKRASILPEALPDLPTDTPRAVQNRP